MAKLIVAVECDFAGYEPFTANRCHYDHAEAFESIRRTMRVVSDQCGGKAAFLIHTSPFVRRNCNDVFYTSPDYLALWREALSQGGELGLHLHEEEPDGSCLYYGYPMHLEKVVSEHVDMLASAGCRPVCESTGYFGLNEWLVPILEAAGLLVNLDNIGVYTGLISVNLMKAPARPYFLDKVNIGCEGNSKVLAIPLGMTEHCRGDDGFFVSRNSLRYLRSLWHAVEESASPDDVFFLWVEAHRMCRDERKLRVLLAFLRSRGVQFLVPSEAYHQFASVRQSA